MNTRAFWILALVGLAAAGCVRETSQENSTPAPTPSATPSAPAATEPKGAANRLKIAVVPKGTTHQFWQTVKAGADAAGGELNVEVLWNGPKKETDIQDQIDIINNYASQGVD